MTQHEGTVRHLLIALQSGEISAVEFAAKVEFPLVELLIELSDRRGDKVVKQEGGEYD